MHLTIAPLTIHIEGITEKEIPVNARLFLDKEVKEADVYYHFEGVDSLPLPDDDWKPMFQRPDIRIWKNGEREARLLAIGRMDAAYALYLENSGSEATVYYLNHLKTDLQIDTVFMSCLAMERQLMKRECYVLHSCFLNYNEQGILFSGPSGIGKSTHAALWCNHLENAHVVNGDRTLIVPEADGTYKACPWPVCGSSNICRKETLPLKAIVFMGQSTENQIVPMRPIQFFKLLTSQLTVNWWEKDFTNRAMDMAQGLMEKVGVCAYSCNLTPDAPRRLEQYLKEKRWIN